MSSRALLLLFCLTLSGAASREVDPVFKDAAATLHEKVTIPVFLPAKLPDLGQGKDAVYAIVEHAAASSYSIILGFTADCNGASVCRIATLSGSVVRQKKLAGKPVRLKNGIAGRYREAECGANCSDATVTWREGRNEYTAGVKGGGMDDAKVLANACL